MTLLIRRPAQIRRTRASATSITTNALRNGLRVDAVPALRPPSESVSFKSGRDARQAGIIPNTPPVNTEMIAVNPRTVVSTSMRPSIGRNFAAEASMNVVPQTAARTPSVPPASESSKLSVRNWRTSRSRPAPSAARIAISLWRAVERASKRLPTFAHAIRSTNPTAPKSIHNAGRNLPTKSSRNVTRCTPLLALSFGCSCASWRAMRFISVCACSSVTPGLSRAIARRCRLARSFSAGCSATGR